MLTMKSFISMDDGTVAEDPSAAVKFSVCLSPGEYCGSVRVKVDMCGSASGG